MLPSFCLFPSLGAGSVVISPSNDYTTFENNTSNFTFNCSGNGTVLFWTVDGYSSGAPYVLNKGIQPTPYVVSPDGPTVSSQLIVPTTEANRNITVICTVLDASYQLQSSNPVRFTLQGTCTVVYFAHVLIETYAVLDTYRPKFLKFYGYLALLNHTIARDVNFIFSISYHFYCF